MEWENIKIKLYNNLFWILLLIGIGLYLLSNSNFEFMKGNEEWSRDIGISVLSSGIFAAVLKSIQFTGIFKKEIENVILDSDYIRKRKDLDVLWRKVSRAMYQSKFHRFSDDLEKIILKDYLPIEENVFYEDFYVTIHVNELTVDDILDYNITTRVNMIPINKDESIEIRHKYEIIPNEDGTRNEQEVLYYKCNSKDLEFEDYPDEKDKNGSIYKVQGFTLQGSECYVMERKVNRKVNIKNDDNIIFRVSHITKKMNVSIHVPDNLNATFINIGVVEIFTKQHEEHENPLNYVHEKGVILPNQGFGISFIKN